MSAGRLICAWLLLLPGTVHCAAVQASADANAQSYRWFSLPLQISNLGAHAAFVPVHCNVDFSTLLEKMGAIGVVDEHSLRLYRVIEGGEEEQPIQFTPEPQPRLNPAPRLPDTPGSVSYLAEFPAQVTPKGLKVAGELSWVARGDKKGNASYRLRFGVRLDGFVVQVPYPPQNLKVFDTEGRATPLPHFPRMQIRPDRPIHAQVDLFDENHLVSSYHVVPTGAGNSSFRRPFFYPLIGPDEVPLTDFGKPHDPSESHAHHYSLWIAHASVSGSDFWSEKGGIIAGDALAESESGPVFCRIVQNLRWMDGGRELLRERRCIVLYHTPEAFKVLDFQLEEYRLRKALMRIRSQKILLQYPEKPTPLAFPIIDDRFREKLSSEKLEERIRKMQMSFAKREDLQEMKLEYDR